MCFSHRVLRITVQSNAAGAKAYFGAEFHYLADRGEEIGNWHGRGAALVGAVHQLAIARGLMLRPRLMLLDEPSHGLSPLITREVFKILREIVEEGTTLLIVEQNANLVLDFADHAYVLETGRLVLDGSAEEIGADEGVRRSYLGMV